MRAFWGEYDNGAYRVGCTGSAVYVCDRAGRELAVFRDLKHAYTGKFLPGRPLFLAKSTAGSLAVYDLDRRALVRRIDITRLGAQDGGFAFSPDGSLLYNIEKPGASNQTRLSLYRTADFTLSETLFADRADLALKDVEFDPETGTCWLLGFFRRDGDGVFSAGFVGQLLNGALTRPRRMDSRTYDYVRAYKAWEASGFTKRAFESAYDLQGAEKIEPFTLKELWEQLENET